jgi:hypothetical protein
MNIEKIILNCAETANRLKVWQLKAWLNQIEAGELSEKRRKIVEALFLGSGEVLSEKDLSFVIRADIHDRQIITLIGE